MNLSLPASLQVVAFDFDNTIAMTASSAPGIKGVEEASREAVEDVFGKPGREAFRTLAGGAGNRSPRELVRHLWANGDAAAMFASALGYLGRNLGELQDCVPKGKGHSLGHVAAPSLDAATEIFVRAKLRLLLPQISHFWPKPSRGFFNLLESLRAEGIRTGILSAGHEVFIRNFFSYHGVESPLLVTDDDVRGGVLEGIQKPDIRMMYFCLDRIGRGIAAGDALYVGDDMVRDGDMAINVGANFGLYDPDGKGAGEHLRERAFRFSCFDELTASFEELIRGKRAMA